MERDQVSTDFDFISASLGIRLAINLFAPVSLFLPSTFPLVLSSSLSPSHPDLAMAPKSGSFATFLILCREFQRDKIPQKTAYSTQFPKNQPITNNAHLHQQHASSWA